MFSTTRRTVLALGGSGLLTTAIVGTLVLFPNAANAAPRPPGASGSAPPSATLNQTAQCLVDDGSQPSSEPGESPEFATVKINPTGLNGGNGKLRTVPVTMTFTDDEADTAAVTVLAISGNASDSSGIGNSASGPADGTPISTTLQLRATPGNTYDVTIQCSEAPTPPEGQNQVTFQITVPS
jgi:hypothetical protein